MTGAAQRKRFYVSDLDGTLLDDRARLSPFARSALSRLLAAGVAFTGSDGAERAGRSRDLGCSARALADHRAKTVLSCLLSPHESWGATSPTASFVGSWMSTPRRNIDRPSSLLTRSQ
jgi:hypothetical protein